MAAPRNRKLILVPGPPTAEEYKRHPRSMDFAKPAPPPSRAKHGKALERALKAAVVLTKKRRHDAGVEVHGAVAGVYVQLESQPGVPLQVTSLEDSRQGIEIVAVSHSKSDEPEPRRIHRATVFVPDGKVKHFLRRADLALYGDLTPVLAGTQNVALRHRLESVKILPPVGQPLNPPDLYGAVTADAVSGAEIQAPERRRAFSMSIAAADERDRGQPTSWSAAVDALAAARPFAPSTHGLEYLDEDDDSARRLFVLCAERALRSANDSLTLVVQSSIRPSNRLAACLGGHGEPEDKQHCDMRKGERDLKFNPADPAHRIEQRIRFDLDGAIASSNAEFDAQLNEVLNLNLPLLKNQRKGVLTAILDWWKSEKARLRGPVPTEQLARGRARRAGDGAGHLPPCDPVAVGWLDQRLTRSET